VPSLTWRPVITDMLAVPAEDRYWGRDRDVASRQPAEWRARRSRQQSVTRRQRPVGNESPPRRGRDLARVSPIEAGPESIPELSLLVLGHWRWPPRLSHAAH